MLAALFSTAKVPPPFPGEHANRHRTKGEDESRARKKERLELEAARRASLIDEESRQLRDIELVVGVSRSRVVEAERITIDGDAFAEDTIEGVPTIDGAGSEQPDPPAY